MECCRFCARNELLNDVFLLYSSHNENVSVFEDVKQKLAFFHASYIDLYDVNLPNTICKSCYSNLDQCYDFFIKVRDTQSAFRNQLSGCSDDETKKFIDLGQIKAEPADATMIKVDLDSILEHNQSCSDPETSLKASDSETIHEENTSIRRPVKKKSQKKSLDKKKRKESKKITALFYAGIPIYEDNASNLELKSYDERTWCDLTWVCRHCKSNVKFRSLQELREHSKELHNTCNALFCSDCNKGYSFFDDFVEHMADHFIQLRFHCQYCNIKLPAEDDMHQHIQLHNEIEKLCPMCGEQFSTPNQLIEHKKQYKVRTKRNRIKNYATMKPDGDDESWLGYKWNCADCYSENVFLDVESLRNHCRDKHSKCIVMKCKDCDEVSDSYVRFVRHVQRHRPYLRNYCHYCNFKFDSPNEVLKHVSKHFDGDVLRYCDYCGDIFPGREDLHKHIALYNPPQPQRIKYKKRERPLTVEELTCNICGHILKSWESFNTHKLIHMDRQRDHTCEMCGDAFYTKNILKAHIEVKHIALKPHECKICKKAFPSVTKLQRHVQTHLGVKPFQCEQCHRCFRLKEHLQRHSIIHTDIMPYQCQFCEKKFRFPNVLKVHQNQHSGERPYRCTDCHMDFANWSNCNKHMKRKHGKTLSKAVVTEIGKIPVNPETGKPKKLRSIESLKEWTDEVMRPKKRGKKAAVIQVLTNTFEPHHNDSLV